MEDSTQPNEKNSTKIIAELEFSTLTAFIARSDHKYFTAQGKICFAIISRIYRRVKAGYYFGSVSIDRDMIVNGNHRYIAYKLANVEFEIVKATRSHCDQLKSFNDIVIDNEYDWDANHYKTIKYCTDDFLEKGDYRRN